MKQYNYYDVVQRVETFVRVNDDWYPNLPDDMVKVTLTMFGGYVKFCAWGADDHGVEMECPCSSHIVWTLWKDHIFDKIPEVVNMDWFFDRGFYPA